MAHVKGSGSVTQHSQGARHGKRFGVKKFAGEKATVVKLLFVKKAPNTKPVKVSNLVTIGQFSL
jgi:ribosomal protein L27